MMNFYNALAWLIGILMGSGIATGYIGFQKMKEAKNSKKTGISCSYCKQQLSSHVDLNRFIIYTDRTTGRKLAYLKPYPVLRAEGLETT